MFREEFSFLFNGARGPGSSLTGEGALWLEEPAGFGRSGAHATVRENPGEGIAFAAGRTDNRSRSSR